MERINLSFNEIILLRAKLGPENNKHYSEIYNYNKLLEFNIKNIFITEYVSVFNNKHLLRGFYIQDMPFMQNLLIRCRKGLCRISILDVRKLSDNYGKIMDVILSSENQELLFVPQGFAIAMLSLDNNTVLDYKSDNLLSDNIYHIINPFDPKLACNWPNETLTISVKDATAPYLDDIIFNFNN